MSKHNNRDLYQSLVLEGFSKASDANIKELEERIASDPSDTDARFKLLGYYSRHQYDERDGAKKLASMTFWLIENMPDCGMIEHWGRIDNESDPESYEESKRLWLAKIEANVDSLRIIGSAASYFGLSDKKLAEQLLRRAITLDPSAPEWSRELGMLLGRGGPERASEAVDAMKEAINKEPSLQHQYYMLDNLAELAFTAGELEQASEAASKSLSLAFTFGKDWNDGNAVHNSNCILGRIALQKGDIETAKKHLALAGDTPGSPQLNSFGPDMDLAEELFTAGEIESVIAYLEACKKFWASDRDQGDLSKAIAQIRNGETPNFEYKFAEYSCPGGDDCDHE